MSSAYDFRTDRLKILSSCCKGRALPMLRASNLPSSCRQSTAMVQITYLNNVVLKNILRENLKKEPKETRDGGGMLALPQSQCWFPWTMSFYSTSFITKACLSIWSLQDWWQALRNGMVISHSCHRCNLPTNTTSHQRSYLFHSCMK